MFAPPVIVLRLFVDDGSKGTVFSYIKPIIFHSIKTRTYFSKIKKIHVNFEKEAVKPLGKQVLHIVFMTWVGKMIYIENICFNSNFIQHYLPEHCDKNKDKW